jgi:hypothetical protein
MNLPAASCGELQVQIKNNLAVLCDLCVLARNQHLPFLALQLFVRISVHLSSPGMKSSPQKCDEGPLDEE